MQARNVGKGFFNTPVNPGVRKRPVHIAEHWQVMHHIAQRGGFD